VYFIVPLGYVSAHLRFFDAAGVGARPVFACSTLCAVPLRRKSNGYRLQEPGTPCGQFEPSTEGIIMHFLLGKKILPRKMDEYFAEFHPADARFVNCRFL
jgi:hypothetical protein